MSGSHDFDLEFYKLHRAHELALNNATSIHEQSSLRLILLLNAAAIAGYLGLVESVGPDSYIAYSFPRARIAVALWVLGIACSFLANVLAYVSQRNFERAYLHRRRGMEAHFADPTDPSWPARYGIDLVGAERPSESAAVADRLARDADAARTSAATSQTWAYRTGIVAALAAVIGFAVAIASVQQRPQPGGAGPTHAGIRSQAAG